MYIHIHTLLNFQILRLFGLRGVAAGIYLFCTSIFDWLADFVSRLRASIPDSVADLFWFLRFDLGPSGLNQFVFPERIRCLKTKM